MNSEKRFEDYPFRVEPLAEEEGGGFTVVMPDLPGLRADGETVEAALADARDAFAAWADAQAAAGRSMPEPGQGGEPVKFVARLAPSLHTRLTEAARADGMSMNTMLTSLVAKGLGDRDVGEKLGRAIQELDQQLTEARQRLAALTVPSTLNGTLMPAINSSVPATGSTQVGSATNVVLFDKSRKLG